MEWDWAFVWQIFPTLVEGVKITILATLLGSVLAAFVGLGIALARRSSNRILSRSVSFAAEFIRGTPLLVQLYFIFYVLPDIGILLAPLVAGVIGLGLHSGTYTAEVYRAGIDNVPRGQIEAAIATGMSWWTRMRRIVLPQALRIAWPAYSNEVVLLLKGSALVSTITVLDLMGQTRTIFARSYSLDIFVYAAVLYLVLSAAITLLLRWIEARMRLPV
jgi:polar amino acid transport system permease protein